MADFLEVGIDASGAVRGQQVFERSVSAIQSAASRLDRDVAALRTRFDAFGQRLQQVGGVLSVAITVPLTLLGRQAIDAAKSFDSLTRGLTAVTGSAEKAKAEMRELREVAKLPGLGFKEAIQGSINLQAAGLSADLARRSLSAFGNALATVGKGKSELEGVNLALSQIVSKGKISAEEINQIAERVPQIRKITEAAFGTSNTEVLQKRGISSQEFITKIVKELEKLPKVTGGVQNGFENLADAIEQALVPVGNVLLRAIIPAIEAVTPAIERATQAFEQLSPATQGVIVAGAAILAALGPVLLLLGAFAGSISSIVGLFGTFGVGVASVVGFLTGVGEVLAVVAVASAALYAAWQTDFGGIRQITADVTSFIQERWAAVAGFFAANGAEIGRALKTVFDGLRPIVEAWSANIKAVWNAVWPVLTETVRVWGGAVGGTVRAVLQAINGDFTGLRATLQRTSAALWEGVKNVFALGVVGVGTLTRGLFQSLTQFAGIAKSTGDTLGRSLANAILVAIKATSPAIFDAVAGIVNFANQQIARIRGAASSVAGPQTPPSALFPRAEADAANEQLQLQRKLDALAKGGGPKSGGGGGSRVKELTDEQKALQSNRDLEKEIANFANARFVALTRQKEALDSQREAITKALALERELATIAPGSRGLGATITPESANEFLRTMGPVKEAFEGLAELVKRGAQVFVSDFVPGVEASESAMLGLRNASSALGSELEKEIETAQRAGRAYESLKSSLQSVIDRSQGLTAAQRAQRTIRELPADFDPQKRKELDELAITARQEEILQSIERAEAESLRRRQANVAEFGRAVTGIFEDAFYRGIVEGPRAFFQTLLSGFADLLAQMAAQLLASQVFKFLSGQLTGAGGGGGGFLGILGNVLGIAGGLFGSFAGASASAGAGGFSSVSGGFGGFGGAIAGAGFATGGTVNEAGYYDVGELGRERVFLPRGAYVQNNHEMRQASQPVVSPVNITVYAQDAKSFNSPQTRDQIARDYNAAMQRSNRNGGAALN